MQALLCSRFGSLDDLTVGEVPSPAPGAGEVLIDVRASALNFPDALMVQGRYQVRPTLPFVPGLEVAGTVAALGAGVDGLAIGARVLAWLDHGGLAEQCVAKATNLAPLPEGMDWAAGAALPITYCTTLHALADRARLASGETLLVLGAAGGVGTAAIQVGKALGARVIAVASTPEKLALCRHLGADHALTCTPAELKARVQELAGQGVDVVYDPVGGAWSEAALRATRWQGRLLVVGFAAGDIPKIPLNLALLQERAILGVFWGEAAKRDPRQQRENVRRLMDWFAAGLVRPYVGEQFTLARAPEALALLANRAALGKLVVVHGA